MKGPHIDFTVWEPSDPLDEAHLQDCPDCSRRHKTLLFMRQHVAAAPRVEAPPFFASRVAHRAKDQLTPFTVLVARTARKLLPALAILVMVVSLGLFLTPQDVAPETDELAVLFVETEEEVDITMVDFIYDLGAEFQEGSFEREQ